MLKESLPMMMTGSIFFILNWIDNIAIGIYWSEASVGLYDTAFKISSASAAILMAVNAIQAPTFAEIQSTHDHQRLKSYVYNSTRLLFYATAPITIGILIFPEFLLGLFGKEFATAGSSLQILALGNFINCITGSVGILLMMTGHQEQYNRIIMVAAILGISLNFLLVPTMGIVGAAISSTVAKVFWNIAAVIYTYKKLGLVSIYLPGLKKPSTNY
jgi:O-antigen/teichoic acid export membrane protein